jgi:hypothetical protein
LTTLAGRSTTSPAAMRLTICSGSWRTGMSSLGECPNLTPPRNKCMGKVALPTYQMWESPAFTGRWRMRRAFAHCRI